MMSRSVFSDKERLRSNTVVKSYYCLGCALRCQLSADEPEDMDKQVWPRICPYSSKKRYVRWAEAPREEGE